MLVWPFSTCFAANRSTTLPSSACCGQHHTYDPLSDAHLLQLVEAQLANVLFRCPFSITQQPAVVVFLQHCPSLTCAFLDRFSIVICVRCATCITVFMAGAATTQCDAEKQLHTSPDLTAASGHTCIKVLHHGQICHSHPSTADLPLPLPVFQPQSSNLNLPNPNLPTPIFQPQSASRCSRG